MSSEKSPSTTASGRAAFPDPDKADAYVAWEWDSADDMQLRLAGTQPRDDYLRDRAERADWVADRLGLTAESDVFEVGSGEGVTAAALAPRVRRIMCSDISRSFLQQAAITCEAHSNVSYHLIDNDFLASLDSASFDAGLSLNVFIHLDAFEVFLYFQQIARILRPGGAFLFNFLDLGPATRPFFHADAARYRDSSVLALKGFMTYYGVDLMSRVAAEAGLMPATGDFVDEDGVGFLTLRRAA